MHIKVTVLDISFNTDIMIAHLFSMEDTTHASKNILKIFFPDTF